MADPVLTATLSGQRKILLSWTYGSNADFQVFWKSSSPPGQEYVLLAATNAFSYTTADLDPSKTYTFYVRANVGATYFYSNVVELFVSCGKGVVLEPSPPPSPPAQIPDDIIYALHKNGISGQAITKLNSSPSIIGRTILSSIGITGIVSSMVQDPLNHDSMYFIEKVGPSNIYTYNVWKFTWPTTITLITFMTLTNYTVSIESVPSIEYNPADSAYHLCTQGHRTYTYDIPFYCSMVDINLTTGSYTQGAPIGGTELGITSGFVIGSYVSGGQLYFVSAGNVSGGQPAYGRSYIKTSNSTDQNAVTISAGVAISPQGILFNMDTTGKFLALSGASTWKVIDFAALSCEDLSGDPPFGNVFGANHPSNWFSDGDWRYYFATTTEANRYLCRYNVSTRVTDGILVATSGTNTGIQGFGLKKRISDYRIAYVTSEDSGIINIARMFNIGVFWMSNASTILVDEDNAGIRALVSCLVVV